MKKPIASLLFCLIPFFIYSLPEHSVNPDVFAGYEDYLGKSVEQVFQQLGAPDHLSVYQGENDISGSVVFGYNSGISFFWVDNRVWQLLIDGKSPIPDGPDFSERNLDSFLEEWGEPLYRAEDMVLYELADMDFPIRCALYFDETGLLSQIYIYRSDY